MTSSQVTEILTSNVSTGFNNITVDCVVLAVAILSVLIIAAAIGIIIKFFVPVIDGQKQDEADKRAGGVQ